MMTIKYFDTRRDEHNLDEHRCLVLFYRRRWWFFGRWDLDYMEEYRGFVVWRRWPDGARAELSLELALDEEAQRAVKAGEWKATA